jgi:endoglucanase
MGMGNNKVKHAIGWAGLSIFLIAGIVAAPRQGNEATPPRWVLNEQEYFARPGVEVLVFQDIYPEGKQGGIELIQHGERIAAVGDVRLAATQGQWGLLPKMIRRSVDRSVPSATVAMRFEKEQLAYRVRVEPCGEAICIAVDLENPLPAVLTGRASFNLELFPPAFFGKSYLLGDSAGVFPLQGNGPLAGNASALRPLPLAKGTILYAASEDPLRRLTIEALGGELQLFDGRDNETNGWFVVTSPIAAGATRDAVRWRITPNVVPGWQREPVIAFSQVGYHPDQEKRALIEFPAATSDLGQATLLRITPGQNPVPVLSQSLQRWGRFLRYDYGVFDFSAVHTPGVYILRHGQKQTTPFRIAADIYRQGVWQPTLETFFPAQMCHMQVADRGRIWHGLCHMDDALQPPPNHDVSYIEGYRQGPTTDTPFAAFQHIPGLNSGGWHDAGDFDLATGSQSWVTLMLALTRENFALDSDQTTVDAQRREVLLHVPDGKPDILQQIVHGVENLLNSYRVAGHSFAGISDPSTEQYQKQGDAASITDNHTYDPSLKPGENRGDYSGRPDDRLAFTTRDTATEFRVIAALAAAARVLADFDPQLASECRITALKAWDYEQTHAATRQSNEYVPSAIEDQEVLAAVELLLTTGERRFAARLKVLLPVIEARADAVGWTVTRVLAKMNDAKFSRRVGAALAKYAQKLRSSLAQNPFGVPFDWQIWGVTWDIQDYAVCQYFLHRAYHREFPRENLLRVLNYIFGCHPASNTSLVSGVGAHSLTVAYGTNVNEWSCIPGGGVSGPSLIRPDLPELKEPFPFLWQQSEYVIGGAATYIFAVLAGERLLEEKQENE